MDRRRAAILLEAQYQYYKNLNRLANAMRTRGNALMNVATRKMSGTPKSHRISPARVRLVRVRRVKTKMTK